MRSETTNNVDLALRKTSGMVTWKINIFHNWIGNYIFVRSADTNGDGVPDRVDQEGTLGPAGEFLVQNFTQGGARFYGAEAETVLTLKPDEINLRLFADYVRGKLNNGGNVPRITPLRFGLEFNHRTGPWTSNMSDRRILNLAESAPSIRTSNYLPANGDLFTASLHDDASPAMHPL